MRKYYKIYYSSFSEEDGDYQMIKLFDDKHKKEAEAYFNTVAEAEILYAHANDLIIDRKGNNICTHDEDSTFCMMLMLTEVVSDEDFAFDDGSFFTIEI